MSTGLDTQIHSVELYRLSTAIEAYRQLWLGTGPMAVDSGNPRVGCCAVCRQIRVLAVSKSDSEFASDPNEELLIFFFRGLSVYIKRGIVPINYNMNLLI